MIVTGTVEQLVILTNGAALTVTNAVYLTVEATSGDFVESWATFGFYTIWTIGLVVGAMWGVRRLGIALSTGFGRVR